MWAIVAWSISLTFTMYVIVFPSLQRVHSLVPVALVSLAGTSFLPDSVAVNFSTPYANTLFVVIIAIPPAITIVAINVMPMTRGIEWVVFLNVIIVIIRSICI